MPGFQWLIRHKHLCNLIARTTTAVAYKFQWLIRHKHLCNRRWQVGRRRGDWFQWLIRHKHLCNHGGIKVTPVVAQCFNGSFAINISATEIHAALGNGDGVVSMAHSP